MSHDAAEPTKPDTRALLDFMFRLAQAYLACGEQTAQVELMLRRMASAYGMRRSRVVAFPTAVFISVFDGEAEHVNLAEGPLDKLRLDQIADVYTLGAAAQRGGISPAEGIERLNEIMRQKPRFGVPGVLVGHVILTVGVALVLAPVITSVGTAAAAVLGALVGVLKIFKRGRAELAVPLPVVAATLVSVLVFLAVKQGLPVEPLHVLVPPLVTFLPGAMLTMGMVELAYGDMVSGASRLIAGFVLLVLLAFGFAAGAMLVGVDLESAPDQAALTPIRWVPWAGVVVFGLGVFLHFSAPRGALPWMLLVMLVAFAAQQFATGLVGSQFSGFFGSLVATPLAYFIHLRLKGPPAMVTFLPSFWILVPGALGLLSIKRMMSDRAAGLDGLITVVFVIASIALGTLLGASLYRWLTETFGSWTLQIGRVGSSFHRRRKQRP